MKNYVNGSGVPMGLGMALAQNTVAMKAFASLPETEQAKIIEHTHTIRSKGEMQAYVQSFSNR